MAEVIDRWRDREECTFCYLPNGTIRIEMNARVGNKLALVLDQTNLDHGPSALTWIKGKLDAALVGNQDAQVVRGTKYTM